MSCTTTPPHPLGEWPYTFALGTFQDKTPDDVDKLEAQVPFRINAFMQGWQHNAGSNSFASQPARLDVVLHKYAATSNARSYALSMEVSLTGYDRYGRKLAQTSGTCSAVQQRGISTWLTMWGDFWQQPADQRGPSPLTLKVRDASMWQKVMDSCVKDLATPFQNTLAAGLPPLSRPSPSL